MRSVPLVQWLLRAGVCTTPWVAVLVSFPAGANASARFSVLLILFSLLAGRYPESPVGIVPPLMVLGWWALAVEDQTHPLVLVAAACLVVGHTCAVVAGLGPASYDVERATLLRWAGRALLVIPVSVLAWVIARAGAGQSFSGAWTLGAVLVVALGVLAMRELADGES